MNHMPAVGWGVGYSHYLIGDSTKDSLKRWTVENLSPNIEAVQWTTGLLSY